jgi:hypothetical protein
VIPLPHSDSRLDCSGWRFGHFCLVKSHRRSDAPIHHRTGVIGGIISKSTGQDGNEVGIPLEKGISNLQYLWEFSLERVTANFQSYAVLRKQIHDGRFFFTCYRGHVRYMRKHAFFECSHHGSCRFEDGQGDRWLMKQKECLDSATMDKSLSPLTKSISLPHARVGGGG